MGEPGLFFRHVSRNGFLLSALVVAAVAAPAAASVLPGAAPARPPVAGVRVIACERGAGSAVRRVEFRGAMRRVSRSTRMGMRFTLLGRVGDGRFEKLPAPGLGVWHRSRSGVRRFAHRQEVLGLTEGFAYRTVVHFRWYGPKGEIVRRARRRSASCRQPGLLPNLRVARIGARPLRRQPGVWRYELLLANRGRASAPTVTASLAVDGAVVDTAAVGGLAPDEIRLVSLNGPACAESVTGRVDPDAAVPESSETDNGRTIRCPPQG